MPEKFYFTQPEEGTLVGGRFRKPQLIDPFDIAFAVNEVFADFSRRKPLKSGESSGNKALISVLSHDADGIAKGIEQEVIEPVHFGKNHFCCLISFPAVWPGIGRKVQVDYKNKRPQKPFGWDLASIPQNAFNASAISRTSSFDLHINPRAIGFKDNGAPQLRVVHIIPVRKDVGMLEEGYHHTENLLGDYYEWLKIASTAVPDEFLGQKHTEVYLDLEPLEALDSLGRLRNQDLANKLHWLFYDRLKDGTIADAVERRGYDLSFKSFLEGERFEIEDECLNCGSLYSFFGLGKEEAQTGKTSKNYCRVCQRETPFKIFYSRHLSKTEEAHFSTMAVLAADTAD